MNAIEQRHHRLTVLGLLLLVLFALGPLLSGPIGALAASRLGAYQHLGALCLTALHALLTPVEGGFHLVLAAGILFASWDRGRAWRHHRAIVGSLTFDAVSPGSRLARAAESSGVDPARIAIVRGLPTPALTIGGLRPRILLAERTIEVLTADQLVRVLAHEAAHLRRRDPARLFLMRFVAKALFWLPLFRRLADDFAEEVEVLADDAAVRWAAPGDAGAKPSAGALLLAESIVTLAAAFASPRGASRLAGAGMLAAHAPDLLERRVRRLMGERVLARSHVGCTHLMTAALALGLFWTGLFPSVHPAGGDGAHGTAHCDHAGWSPFAHLICRCDDEAAGDAGNGDAGNGDAVRSHCDGMH